MNILTTNDNYQYITLMVRLWLFEAHALQFHIQNVCGCQCFIVCHLEQLQILTIFSSLSLFCTFLEHLERFHNLIHIIVYRYHYWCHWALNRWFIWILAVHFLTLRPSKRWHWRWVWCYGLPVIMMYRSVSCEERSFHFIRHRYNTKSHGDYFCACICFLHFQGHGTYGLAFYEFPSTSISAFFFTVETMSPTSWMTRGWVN